MAVRSARLVVVLADMRVHRRQPAVGRVRRLRRRQVVGDAGHADDRPVGIAQRLLVGQAPARLATGIEVQLQLVLQRRAAAQHAPILLGIERTEAGREDLVGAAAEQFGLVLHAAAACQGAVDQDVAGALVLDEEHHAGHGVEQRLDLAQAGQQAGEVGGGRGGEQVVHRGEGLAGGPRQHTGRRRPGTGPGRAPQLPGESQRNGAVRTRRR